MKNEKALFSLTYGLFLLAAREGEKDNGCIINTAIQVTDAPNRLAVAVNKRNLTHDMIQTTGHFSLSVLSEEADFSLFQRFGFQSGREADKFQGFSQTRRGADGLLVLTEGANAWLSGRVTGQTDLGTHTLFLAEVTDGDVISTIPSATYAYYHAHIKPKVSPAPGPGTPKRWVCRVCGYVYEGDALPADFICPVCKHPASDFELREA